MPGKGQIETGVDKLLTLIQERKIISVADAAKLLGVSSDVAEEWGNFLEDEGYITKEYKLTKAYFSLKAMDSEGIEKKAENIEEKKEGFIKKAEVHLAQMQQDSEVIGSLKVQFEKLKKDIGKELKDMKVELGELERYEYLKNEIDKKLKTQEEEYKKRFEKINKEILAEQKQFQDVIDKIDAEEVRLQKEKEESLSMMRTEQDLHQRVNDLIKEIEGIKNVFKENESHVENSEKTITNLRNIAEKIKKEIENKKKDIDALILENKEYEKKIIEGQKELLKNIKSETQKVSSHKKDYTEDKFKAFFKEKKEIEDLLRDLENEKSLLEGELQELIKKAKAFKVSASSKNLSKNVKDLETHFRSTEKRRSEYVTKMDKLKKTVGLNDISKKKKWLFFGK
jgi:chromosome segregation ATPase